MSMASNADAEMGVLVLTAARFSSGMVVYWDRRSRNSSPVEAKRNGGKSVTACGCSSMSQTNKKIDVQSVGQTAKTAVFLRFQLATGNKRQILIMIIPTQPKSIHLSTDQNLAHLRPEILSEIDAQHVR